MRKALVIVFNLIFVLPMLIYGGLGMGLYFVGRAIEDSFTYWINPLRSSMYRWAWKRGRK